MREISNLLVNFRTVCGVRQVRFWATNDKCVSSWIAIFKFVTDNLSAQMTSYVKNVAAVRNCSERNFDFFWWILCEPATKRMLFGASADSPVFRLGSIAHALDHFKQTASGDSLNCRRISDCWRTTKFALFRYRPKRERSSLLQRWLSRLSR